MRAVVSLATSNVLIMEKASQLLIRRLGFFLGVTPSFQ
jgi:hypothetical protein